jgi:hypothetical protein
VVYNKEFGYSRKDVLIIIVGLIGLGVVMYEGLQAAGMDAGMAGNVVQATIFLGICVGWVSTYLWRVANKVRPGSGGQQQGCAFGCGGGGGCFGGVQVGKWRGGISRLHLEGYGVWCTVGYQLCVGWASTHLWRVTLW